VSVWGGRLVPETILFAYAISTFFPQVLLIELPAYCPLQMVLDINDDDRVAEPIIWIDNNHYFTSAQTATLSAYGRYINCLYPTCT
jgi:hypothetical protein